jgi:UDP-N-acetylglucosamine--N-acetylmuramyl-(pentapeptide) pyrophosphoryl-undecaprenol N-acetylglucosamine transferase
LSTASRHFVLAAGGTGGHLTPAFALAQELERRGHQVALITDARGAAIPGRPDFLDTHVLPAGRFTKNPMGWLRAISAVMKGRAQAKRLYAEFAPSAVVGFGGYPALPALLGASGAGVPTVIHEQNAVLGRVNRLLAGRVDAIATAYPDVQRLSAAQAKKVHLVGNPVRAGVLSLREEPYPPPSADAPLRVLVTGGSQGARVLSQVVPEGFALLPPALKARLIVTQQCRSEDIDAVRARYAAEGIEAELASFFEDMQARLAGTHLFIGRAGASTIAELTAVGRPAILVPLPIATDDHQTANAREMAQAGAARAIPQPAFTPQAVAQAVEELAGDPEGLIVAAHAAWNCGRPDAAKDLADLVESFGGAPIMDVIRVGRDPVRPVAGAPISAGASTRSASAGGAPNSSLSKGGSAG